MVDFQFLRELTDIIAKEILKLNPNNLEKFRYIQYQVYENLGRNNLEKTEINIMYNILKELKNNF